jgi:hypothetical protein
MAALSSACSTSSTRLSVQAAEHFRLPQLYNIFCRTMWIFYVRLLFLQGSHRVQADQQNQEQPSSVQLLKNA